MDLQSALLRKAVPEDVDILYQWCMDEDVRKNAFVSEDIDYLEHQKWFHKKISSQYTYMYVYEYDRKPVGQVRVDVINEKGYIDYSIDRRYRNKGHGKNMLFLLESKLKEDHCGVHILVSQVKDRNITSQIVFERLNYCKAYIEYQKCI